MYQGRERYGVIRQASSMPLNQVSGLSANPIVEMLSKGRVNEDIRVR